MKMKSLKKVLKGLAITFTVMLAVVGLWDLLIMDVVPLAHLGKFAISTAVLWLLHLLLNAGSIADIFKGEDKKFDFGEMIKFVLVIALYIVSAASILLGGIRFLFPKFWVTFLPAGDWKWIIFGGAFLLIGCIADRFLTPDSEESEDDAEDAVE